MRLQLSVARFDNPPRYRKGLDAEADRTVALARRLPKHHDIGNDLLRNSELGVCPLAGHPIVDVFRIRPRNPKAQLMAFADKRQRLPVS